MATATDDRLLEQARGIAVSLDAELAVVASLVRAGAESELMKHNHSVRVGGTTSHDCPTCQLVAWAATA